MRITEGQREIDVCVGSFASCRAAACIIPPSSNQGQPYLSTATLLLSLTHTHIYNTTIIEQ